MRPLFTLFVVFVVLITKAAAAFPTKHHVFHSSIFPRMLKSPSTTTPLSTKDTPPSESVLSLKNFELVKKDVGGSSVASPHELITPGLHESKLYPNFAFFKSHSGKEYLVDLKNPIGKGFHGVIVHAKEFDSSRHIEIALKITNKPSSFDWTKGITSISQLSTHETVKMVEEASYREAVVLARVRQLADVPFVISGHFDLIPMVLVPGVSLQSILSSPRTKTLMIKTPHLIDDLFGVCLDALSDLHSLEHVVHRDLNLENILVEMNSDSTSGQASFKARIIDFGLARIEISSDQMITKLKGANASHLASLKVFQRLYAIDKRAPNGSNEDIFSDEFAEDFQAEAQSDSNTFDRNFALTLRDERYPKAIVDSFMKKISRGSS